MTSSTSPTIASSDRFAPNRPAGPSAPRRRRWLASAAVCVATVAVAGAGFVAYQAVSGGEIPKPRLAAIKIGPLADMPDLKNGVPALVSKLTASPARAPAEPADDANRKAMASTIAAAAVNPPVSAPVALRTEASIASKAAPAAATTTAAAVSPSAEPVRRVDIQRPTETASLGETRQAAAPPASPAPVAAPPAQSSPPAPAAAEAPVVQPRLASLPADVPLPPRRPSLPAADVAAERAPAAVDRAAPTKPRPVATAQPRPVPVAQAPMPQRSAAAEPEEERSVLGVPVPRFVPTGRDIRDAAASVGNAITSIPDRF